ncbi:MAG: hypothetical protein GWP58_10290 [Gammaproteobacteria bacterium]|jgi:hypothetical protein|nr:hypothetical protein [Gammaproteobacteria bacterium]
MIWTVNITVWVILAHLSNILMINNDKEVEHAASNMIDRYGDSALHEVDLRILELQSRNQQEALRLWREIRNRVNLLLQKKSDL